MSDTGTKPMPPFSQMVAYRRRELGWTQAEAAQRAELSTTGWRHIEFGEKHPRKPTVRTLARVLGIDTNDALAAAGYEPDGDVQIPEQSGFISDLGHRLRPGDRMLVESLMERVIAGYQDEDDVPLAS